ncbi:PH domain-containing protein [Thalassotalea sp. PS06]|uniref:PH domain-containing protein n=1 Tax=Thalassotalea sp. PS06 TaxID=2594005 RepID=UPI00163D660D|nr:PH domain-containing protein [Thalassotalea sp. PS06]
MTDNTSPSGPDSSGELSTKQWHRISPIAVIFYALRFIRGFVGNIAYLLPALLVGYNQIQNNPEAAVPLALGLGVLVLVSAVLSYWFFQYRLTENHLEIRSGVFAKKYVNLPFNRIQNVEVSHPWYYRPFGYATLKLDSAGSVQQEANIAALETDFAQQLKQEILSQRQSGANSKGLSAGALGEDADLASTGHQSPASSDSETLLNTRSLSDLVLHGIANNRVWIVLGALAPFIDNLTEGLPEYIEAQGIDAMQIFYADSTPIWQLGLGVLVIFLVVMALMSLISVIGAIITFYGYTLSKADNKYIRRSGLFTRHEITMPHSRLQMVTCQQDWLDRLFKRINIKFEQTNANNAQQGQPSISEGTNKIIVPSVTIEERQALLDDAYPENQLNQVEFHSISKRYLLRFYLVLGIIAAPLMALFALNNNWGLFTLTLAFSGFLSVVFYMRYRRWGVNFDGHFVYIRKGCFGVDYHVFEAYKLQQIQLKQSIWQKRHQLASIQFVLASGSLTVPFINQDLAKTIADSVLYQVECKPRSWM